MVAVHISVGQLTMAATVGYRPVPTAHRDAAAALLACRRTDVDWRSIFNSSTSDWRCRNDRRCNKRTVLDGSFQTSMLGDWLMKYRHLLIDDHWRISTSRS